MKVLFVSHIPEDNSNGVWKKILSQVNSLRDLGYEVTLVNFSEAGNLKISTHSEVIFENKISHRYLFFYYLTNLIITGFDIVYVRKPHGGLYPIGLTKFLKKLKKMGSNKIFMEIPTYPFKNESKGFIGKVTSLIFEWQILFARKYIDKFLVIGDKIDVLYGVEVENIINGVDATLIKPIVSCNVDNGEKKSIKLLGVANLTYWHGYDRLIKGLKEYNGNVPVDFLIIGDNEPEFSRLKRLAKDLSLDNVHFKGKMNTSQINNIVKSIDICIDSLGRHRSGNNANSSIKSKEYTALGIPFILSHDDPAFISNPDFILKCNADDEPINIDLVLKWFYSLPKDMHIKESQYAFDNFTWQSIFKKIL